jgi:uncharacterized repeat protein (TIGR01451 family)
MKIKIAAIIALALLMGAETMLAADSRKLPVSRQSGINYQKFCEQYPKQSKGYQKQYRGVYLKNCRQQGQSVAVPPKSQQIRAVPPSQQAPVPKQDTVKAPKKQPVIKPAQKEPSLTPQQPAIKSTQEKMFEIKRPVPVLRAPLPPTKKAPVLVPNTQNQAQRRSQRVPQPGSFDLRSAPGSQLIDEGTTSIAPRGLPPNAGSSGPSRVLPDPAELAILSIEVLEDRSLLIPGGYAELGVDVENTGEATPRITLSASDLVGYEASTGAVRGGETRRLYMRIPLRGHRLRGDFLDARILLAQDDGNPWRDTLSADNERVVRIRVGRPELAIIDLRRVTREAVRPGDDVQFTARVRNTGNASVNVAVINNYIEEVAGSVDPSQGR